MQKSAGINRFSKAQSLLAFAVSTLLFMGLGSSTAYADFATPNLTSPPNTCPINHKMYYLGRNPPAYTPKVSTRLIWPSGDRDEEFIFENNKVMRLTFSQIVDPVEPANLIPFFGEGQFDGNGDGVYDVGNENTRDAINLRHGNEVGQNHVFDLQINRNVSKIGYKIQDVDSNGIGVVRYQQRVDVSPNGGIFDNLSFNSALQNINSSNNVITAERLQGCSLGQCVIDASWRYKPANNAVRLRHSNIDRGFLALPRNHIVGYSDFYFCLAPPKLMVKKALDGTRVNDTDNKRDQFEISIRNNNTALSTFTTSGNSSTINNNSSNTVSLAENTQYTITERIMNGSTLGDIGNYNASYTCNNATTGTPVTIASGTPTYDANSKTRSFTLSGVTYGDEITCTITNTPTSYSFSGIVFNDNGGITNPDLTNDDITSVSSPYANNDDYFNGLFDDNSETGIASSQVKLADCRNPSTVYATQPVTASGADIGRYTINVPVNSLNGNLNNLCLIEERLASNYSIRTTSEQVEITTTAGTYNYTDKDFGRVIKANAALVLKKYQYTNDCPAELNYSTVGDSASDPSAGFSTEPIADITPGQCIAYRITATNRSNLAINNFVMRDTLQKKGVNNAVVTSVLANPTRPTGIYTDLLTTGQNGTVVTRPFVLAPRSKLDFYFNTQYGSTQSP